MRPIVLFVLAFTGFVLANNCELCSFVMNDSLIAKYDEQCGKSDTAEIFEILDKQNGVYFTDVVDMGDKIGASLEKYPIAQTIVRNNIIASKSLQLKLNESIVQESPMEEYVWINSNDVQFLKAHIRDTLLNYPYSKSVSGFMKDMSGIIFADSTMMRDYALALFAASLGVCYDTTSVNSFIKNILWKKGELVDLFRHKYGKKIDSAFVKKCIDADSGIGPMRPKDGVESVLEQDCRLNRILTRWYKNLNCSEDRWYRAMTLLDTLYDHLLEGKVSEYTERKKIFPERKPIVWKGNDCGCSQYKELNGNVYAVYPYWLAKEGGDTLDFGVVTRIAYYGIVVDDFGVLRLPSDNLALPYFNKPGFSDFVNVAHKHNVKVDWIVRKDDWSKIKNDKSEMEIFFEKLISQVDSLVSRKNTSLFTRFVNAIPPQGNDTGLRGDGVTLWFKNYPTDSLNTALFKKYFVELQNHLRKENEFAFVNVMMDLYDLVEKKNIRIDSVGAPKEKGIYNYHFFNTLQKESNDWFKTNEKHTNEDLNENLRNFLIVFNNEPVSRNKLVLYNDLNQQLSGDERTDVLHAVVPLLWLDYKQLEQLENDASFYNDAFYSLGISPYGVLNDVDDGENQLSQVLLNKFEKEDGQHKRQSAIGAFFCKNRGWFRLLNMIVYAFVFVLLICYFAICRLNAYFSKRLALFVALVAVPPLLTTLILSNFDPMFMDFVGNIGRWGSFVVIVLMVIAITLLQVYRSNDIPKRIKK